MLKTYEVIQIDGPVGVLETIVIRPAVERSVKLVAVLLHPNPTQGGTNTNKVIQTAAKALSQLGYWVLCPNLRGVGNSDGVHDFGCGEVDDALAVIEFAKQMFYKIDHFVLGGFSFGGFVACKVNQIQPADQMLIIAAAVDKYREIAPAVPSHTVFIHGEMDEVIPLANVMTWARPQQLPIVVVPGASHFFHGYLIVLGNLIKKLLK